MNSLSPSTLVRRCFAFPLLLCATFPITACVHRQVGQILPQVTLSDTRTKRNLAVGQLFFANKNGDLVDGPNLQSLGLLSHSVSLSPVSVSQPNITLGEFLSAIGASSASCDASLPRPSAPDGPDWFQKEKHAIVGVEVSLLLEDVSEEVAEPKSLGQLVREEHRKPTGTVPFAQIRDSTYEHTVVVVQALYARQAILRFRVPENTSAGLALTSEYFLGYDAKNVEQNILTLIKIASVCGAQVHARELPDPGFELDISNFAMRSMGAGMARIENGKANVMTQVETALSMYLTPRLPAYSLESNEPSQERVWKVDTDSARAFLNDTHDRPKLGDESTFFKYCPGGVCNDAIITSPHEFDRNDGRSYKRSTECTVGQAPSRWNLVGRLSGYFQREAELRELVLFFGPQPPDDAGYSDYTSEMVHTEQPKNLKPSPKSGPTNAVWIYEYHCEAGIAQLRKHPHGILDVSTHLKGMGLE